MSIPNAMKKIIAYFREANHKRLEQRRILKRQGRGQMRFLEQPSARTSFFETLASNQSVRDFNARQKFDEVETYPREIDGVPTEVVHTRRTFEENAR